MQRARRQSQRRPRDSQLSPMRRRLARLSVRTCSSLGIIWAVAKLATSNSRRDRGWRRPVLVLIPSAAVLAFIIGSSYNSYRNSLGPPGDHSVANASADTRALWQAANAGNVALVAFGRELSSLDGQVFVFFVLAVAAAEAAIGLALLIAVFRHKTTVNLDEFTLLRW